MKPRPQTGRRHRLRYVKQRSEMMLLKILDSDLPVRSTVSEPKERAMISVSVSENSLSQ